MYKINKYTGRFDDIGGIEFSATAPSSPLNGQFWVDTTTGNFYVYYGSDWQILASLENNTTPATAILDETGATILDETGDFILAEN